VTPLERIIPPLTPVKHPNDKWMGKVLNDRRQIESIKAKMPKIKSLKDD